MRTRFFRPNRDSARRMLVPTLLLGTVALMVSGCPSGASLENPDDYLKAPAACDAIPIFEVNCAGGICHETDEGKPPAGGVDLLAPGVGARLLDVNATYPGLSVAADGCPEVPEKLVDSAGIESSLMWTKLNNTQVCGDGMPIPHSASKLNSSEMDCVRSWMQDLIDNGSASGTGGTGLGGAGTGTGGGGPTGGAPGTGGGTSEPAADITIQAECALALGVCSATQALVMGSNTGPAAGQPAAEADMMKVGYIVPGVTLTYSAIETAGHDTMVVKYSQMGDTGGLIKIHLGSATGTEVGTIDPGDTLSWDTYQDMTVQLSQSLSGPQTLVFVAEGVVDGVLNLDSFTLSVGGAL